MIEKEHKQNTPITIFGGEKKQLIKFKKKVAKINKLKLIDRRNK